jgi:hypothetical protein
MRKAVAAMIEPTLLLTDGALLTLVFSVFVISTLLWKPRMWIHDFPADIQALIPPKTADEQRLTRLMAVPFFVMLFGGLGLTAARYGTANGFIGLFVHVYLVWQIVNLFDLLVIDWVGMSLVDPQNPPFPGTEGAQGYRDYLFHLVGFLKGSVMGLVLALVTAGVVWLLMG